MTPLNLSEMRCDENSLRYRTWAEISLGAAEHNYKVIRDLTPTAGICCVIKGNAYGHGAVMLGHLYESLGAAWFAVSNIEEALQLRQGGIRTPILILGYTPVHCAELLAKYGIAQCVYSEDYGRALGEHADRAGVRVRVHIKLDTGMGRIGFLCRNEEQNELEQILNVCSQNSLEPEGLFAHFSSADCADGETETKEQMQRFEHAERFLSERGLTFSIRHCANSAGIMKYADSHLDMVRAGIILYGYPPGEGFEAARDLIPVMTVRTVVSYVKELRAGETVGYGRSFRAEKPMRVATIPIGYADGLHRTAGNGRYSVMVNEKPAPIIGRICMDQVMLDVTDVPCSPGDPVTVFGTTPGNTADDLAAAAGTISYEVLCAVGGRVPRAYTQKGKLLAWTDLLYDQDLKKAGTVTEREV